MITRREYLSISWLKTYILNKKEYGQTDSMNFGALVDVLFYTPELFNKKYFIYKGEEDTYTKLIDEHFNNFKSFDGLSNKLAQNTIPKNVTKEETKQTKIKEFKEIFKNYENYFNLKVSICAEPNVRERKSIVFSSVLTRANDIVNQLQNSEHFKWLQSLSDEHYYQFDRVVDVEIYNVWHKLRVILDHLIIGANKITIVDLKVTDSPIEGFHFVADKLRYDLQAAFYKRAIYELYQCTNIDFYWFVYSTTDKKTALIKASEKMLKRGATGDLYKKGYIDLINIYELSHQNGYDDYDFDYNNNQGFLNW